MEKSPNTLARIPTKYIFSSYFIGKEKLYLTVAHHFNWRVNVTDHRLKAFQCFSNYTKNLLNKTISQISSSIDRIEMPSKTLFMTKVEVTQKEDKKLPLELICQEDHAQIDILPHNLITANHLSEKYGDKKYRRLVVFYGTGWSRKEKFMDLMMKNGTKYKKGIRMIQYPYSEHSSSLELQKFSGFIRTNEIFPTVVFKSLNDI